MTIPMPLAAGADPRSYPLIAALFSRHGYAEVRGCRRRSRRLTRTSIRRPMEMS